MSFPGRTRRERARGKSRAPDYPRKLRLDQRFRWIVESALKNRHQQSVIDGEAVVLGVDGISDFNALQSRRHDEEVQPYAFDRLALEGEDLRGLPLSMRKTNLARLPARAGRRASSSRPSSRVRSAPTYSARPVSSGSRGWSRSALIGPTAPDDRKTG